MASVASVSVHQETDAMLDLASVASVSACHPDRRHGLPSGRLGDQPGPRRQAVRRAAVDRGQDPANPRRRDIRVSEIEGADQAAALVDPLEGDDGIGRLEQAKRAETKGPSDLRRASRRRVRFSGEVASPSWTSTASAR